MHPLGRPIASKSAVGAKGVETRDLSARERDARVKRIGPIFESPYLRGRILISPTGVRARGEGRRKRDVK